MKVPNSLAKKTLKKHSVFSQFVIANHVLKISVELKFQCVCFEKKAMLCSSGFELVSYLFLLSKGLFKRLNFV